MENKDGGSGRLHARDKKDGFLVIRDSGRFLEEIFSRSPEAVVRGTTLGKLVIGLERDLSGKKRENGFYCERSDLDFMNGKGNSLHIIEHLLCYVLDKSAPMEETTCGSTEQDILGRRDVYILPPPSMSLSRAKELVSRTISFLERWLDGEEIDFSKV